MKSRWWWLAGLALVAALASAGCKAPEAGTDAISTRVHAEYSGPDLDCRICHTYGGALDPEVTNGFGSAGKHSAHVGSLTFPCESCHTGYYAAKTHMNGRYETDDPAVLLVGFEAQNPSGQWSGDTGAGTGGCATTFCHQGSTPDWYGTVKPVVTDCRVCHSWPMISRRAVAGAQGNFRGNPAITSGHVVGSADPVPAQCEVCHDQTGHMNGEVDLRAPDSGTRIVYNGDNPAALEPFCLGCHDANGATVTSATSGGSATDPFNETITMGVAPYPFALTIAASWAKTYGHKANFLTCMDCHGHNGALNGHGGASDVMTRETFALNNTAGAYNASNYALCFNCHANYPGVTKEDLLGVKQGGNFDYPYGILSGGNGPDGWNPPYYTSGLVTLFRDHNEPLSDPDGLNDSGLGWDFWTSEALDGNINLHWFHLGVPAHYRGQVGTPVNANCVNCHDVHGSNNANGAVYDAMNYTHTTTVLLNSYGEMDSTAYTDPAFLGGSGSAVYPFYCGMNCHASGGDPMGPTKAWFDPITE